MSYNTVARMAQDADLRLRLIACAAQEQAENPGHWVDQNLWDLVASPGWGAAYASAEANPAVERPGYDEGAVTDGMILTAVQARVSALDQPEDKGSE